MEKPELMLVPFSAPEAKCKCGLHVIPANVYQIEWLWGHHRRDVCTIDEPGKLCWCGLMHSEHQTVHGYTEGAAVYVIGPWSDSPPERPTFFISML